MARANLPWPTHDYTSMGPEVPHLTIAKRLGCLAPGWPASSAEPAGARADGNVAQPSSGDSSVSNLMETNPTGCFSEGQD